MRILNLKVKLMEISFKIVLSYKVALEVLRESPTLLKKTNDVIYSLAISLIKSYSNCNNTSLYLTTRHEVFQKLPLLYRNMQHKHCSTSDYYTKVCNTTTVLLQIIIQKCATQPLFYFRSLYKNVQHNHCSTSDHYTKMCNTTTVLLQIIIQKCATQPLFYFRLLKPREVRTH